MNGTLLAQHQDTWIAFWNSDTTLIGYKDKSGGVKIEPRFAEFSCARKFDHIIAVAEKVNEKQWKRYYLTKSGKIVGRDSLHILDNSYDCESEGFIRFRDSKTDKTGMFNKKGDIVIPAEYNELTSVRNGMIIGLKGAEKKFWDEDSHSGCNHFSWTGGTKVLIDTLNNILVDNFKYDGNLNFFSLERTGQPAPDSIRKSFLTEGGNYFSFIDFEKEFGSWITNKLISNLTRENLLDASLDSIIWESGPKWSKSLSREFIEKNFELIKSKLLDILNPKCEYSVLSEGLNPYMYEGPEFEKYYNNCGEAKAWIYPVMSVVISRKSKKGLAQNNFEFLRTDNGYKLICLTIRNGQVK